jgi:hypothetical protein
LIRATSLIRIHNFFINPFFLKKKKKVQRKEEIKDKIKIKKRKGKREKEKEKKEAEILFRHAYNFFIWMTAFTLF